MILSSRRRIRLAGAAVAFATLALAHGPSLAGTSVNTGYFGGVAIMGYDPVAYFTEGRPVKGTPGIAYDWLGATWNFAKPEHKELFVSDPVRYAPQYGGYCASGMANSESTANIDPGAWRIVNGKLYLHYDKADASVWNPDDEKLGVAKADANWPAVQARLQQE
jgi:hypothetical protein